MANIFSFEPYVGADTHLKNIPRYLNKVIKLIILKSNFGTY